MGDYCRTGKAAYRTRGAALRALERIRVDNAQAVAPVADEITPKRAYRCGFCGAWHLTKSDQRKWVA